MTLNLDAIKARAEAATKGPWASGRDWGTITSGPDSVAHGWHETTCPDCDGTVYTQGHVSISVEDLEFITASRTDIPALVAEVERLRAQVASVHRLHEKVAVLEWDEPLGDSAFKGQYACRVCLEMGDPVDYPCDTVRALEGE